MQPRVRLPDSGYATPGREKVRHHRLQPGHSRGATERQRLPGADTSQPCSAHRDHRAHAVRARAIHDGRLAAGLSENSIERLDRGPREVTPTRDRKPLEARGSPGQMVLLLPAPGSFDGRSEMKFRKPAAMRESIWAGVGWPAVTSPGSGAHAFGRAGMGACPSLLSGCVSPPPGPSAPDPQAVNARSRPVTHNAPHDRLPLIVTATEIRPEGRCLGRRTRARSCAPTIPSW